MQTSKNTYYPALTSLRALAALIVFFHHYPLQEKWVGYWGHSFFQEWYFGVSIFFVLSGFVVHNCYAKHVSISKGWLLHYLQNRFARIYPLYAFVTLITIVGCWNLKNPHEILNGHQWLTLWTNLSFVRGFCKDLFFTGVAQGWTLSIEMLFYLLAPVIFLCQKRINLFWQLLFVYLIGYLIYTVWGGKMHYGFMLNLPFVAYGTFFGRALDFFIGMQLSIWIQKRSKQLFGSSLFTFGGCVLLLFCLVVMVCVKGEADYGYYTLPGLLINNFILPFPIALLIWGLLTEQTWLRKLLEHPFCEICGKASYSFYLIHLGLFSDLLFKHVTHNYYYNFPIIALVSYCMYRWIEYPLQNMLKHQNF